MESIHSTENIERVESAIRIHVSKTWLNRAIEEFSWKIGPISASIPGFRVARVSPGHKDKTWVYVSLGAWKVDTGRGPRLEFFIVSAKNSPEHVESLAMMANFHADGRWLISPGTIIEIGRPWMEESTCDHFLVSVPYPIEPTNQFLKVENAREGIEVVGYLWLVPITRAEAEFARLRGVESLEQLFESEGIDYTNARRVSVV